MSVSRWTSSLALLLLAAAPACGDSSADTETSTGEATSSTTPAAEPCTPGESIACACTDGGEGAQVCAEDGLSFAECVCEPGGSTEGESETGVDTESTETDDTTGEPVEPSPRWVLRDRDGIEVDAVVEPRCFNGEPASKCTNEDSPPPPCFWAWSVSGEYRGVVYSIADGSFASCTSQVRDDFILYSDAECTNPLMAHEPDSFNPWLVVAGVTYRGDPATYAEVSAYTGDDCGEILSPLGVATPVAVGNALETVPGSPFTLDYE